MLRRLYRSAPRPSLLVSVFSFVPRRAFGVGERKRRLKETSGIFKRSKTENLTKQQESISKALVKFWYSYAHDDTEKDALPTMVTNMKAFLKKVAEQHRMTLHQFRKQGLKIEVFQDGDWVEVKNIAQVKEAQVGTAGARIRVPDFFENANDDLYPELNEWTYQGERLQLAFNRVMAKLKEKGWTPVSTEPPFSGEKNQLQMVRLNSHEIVPTKKILIQEAGEDADLQNLMLTRIGAVQHLLQCLHYPFAWNPRLDYSTLPKTKEDLLAGACKLPSFVNDRFMPKPS